MKEYNTEILIVGGGPGGIFTSKALLFNGLSDFKVVCDELDVVCRCNLPYGIGKKFLPSIDDAVKSHSDFVPNFDDVGIKGRVTRIDHDNRIAEGTLRESGDKFTVKYKKLILTMGAQAAVPPIKGALKPEGEKYEPTGEVVFYKGDTYDKAALKDNIVVVRSFADGKRIDALCEKVSKVAVIGSGFVGLEILENLVDRGKEVTLVEILPHVIATFDQDMADVIEERLKDHGVKLLLGHPCTEVRDGAIVVNGEAIETDLVVIGAGATPDTELAGQVGCKTGKAGVRVDSQCRTSVEDVYAIGDLIELEGAVFPEPTLLQLLPNVMIQGTQVALDIKGTPVDGPAVVGAGMSHTLGLFWGSAGYGEEFAESRELRTVAQKLELFTAEAASPMAKKGWYKMIAAAEDKNGIKKGQIIGFQAVTEEKHLGDLMARWADIIGAKETVYDLPKHNWIHQPMVGEPGSNAYIMMFFNQLKSKLEA